MKLPPLLKKEETMEEVKNDDSAIEECPAKNNQENVLDFKVLIKDCPPENEEVTDKQSGKIIEGKISEHNVNTANPDHYSITSLYCNFCEKTMEEIKNDKNNEDENTAESLPYTCNLYCLPFPSGNER